MTQGYNNMSAYQQMIAESSPAFIDEYGIANGIVQPKVKPQVIKNQNPSLMRQLSRNVGQTGKALSNVGKASSKVGGKAVPALGVGLTGYDIYRSNAIADELEKINKVKPNTVPKGAIDYYRNKARAIGAGAILGTGAGAVLGSGAFSVPGAAVGLGTGGSLADGIYQLFQSRNPYKEYLISPEEAKLLEEYYRNANGSKNNQPTNTPNSDVPPGTVPYNPESDGYDLSDIPQVSTRNSQVAKANAIAKQINESTQQNAQPITTDDKEEILKQYIAMLKDRNAPYIKALNSYLSNYPRLLDQSARNDLYFYGANLAKGLNPRAGEKFNQVKNYENMVGIVKAIEDAKNAGVDYANEVTGNMDVAQTLGLSPQAAYANKNLLSAYSMGERDKVRQAIANANYLTKLYGIDSRAALQLTLQQMKNENAANVARIYMGLTEGAPAVGLTPTGKPQQTQTRSADPRQQFFD
jgi:hypothetical protein